MAPSVLETIIADDPETQSKPEVVATTSSGRLDEDSKEATTEKDVTRPSSLRYAANPTATPAMRRRGRIQFATLCWSIFVAGWNDGTLGPLLLRLQAVYHVRTSTRYAQVYGC